jgi:hypothetical protein
MECGMNSPLDEITDVWCLAEEPDVCRSVHVRCRFSPDSGTE